jgi:hypothetical protein
MSDTSVERDTLLPRTQSPTDPDREAPREGNIIERLDLMPEVKDRRAVYVLTVCSFSHSLIGCGLYPNQEYNTCLN